MQASALIVRRNVQMQFAGHLMVAVAIVRREAVLMVKPVSEGNVRAHLMAHVTFLNLNAEAP